MGNGEKSKLIMAENVSFRDDEVEGQRKKRRQRGKEEGSKSNNVERVYQISRRKGGRGTVGEIGRERENEKEWGKERKMERQGERGETDRETRQGREQFIERANESEQERERKRKAREREGERRSRRTDIATASRLIRKFMAYEASNMTRT